MAAARPRTSRTRIRDAERGRARVRARTTTTAQIEEERWIGDEVIRELGEIGAAAASTSTRSTAARASRRPATRASSRPFAQIDATLSIVLGVHQSIGFKGIALFGTDEQKERFLPDLASGPQARRLRADRARGRLGRLQHRVARGPAARRLLGAERREALHRQRLARADVFTDLRPREVDGKDRHIALILEKGMKGFEVGERYDTMGLRGNDLRRLYFNDVRVPAENVLGEPGEGFRIAMQILNNGRIGLGTGSVGGAKKLLDLAIEHVKERRQFGQPLADFELVQDKIGWMVSYLFGLESMCYLTCGLVDAGVADYSLESAICKVAGTEFLWYAANRALQLAGGAGYMRDEPYEKILRDIRIFPIFEGANDVLRAFIALAGIKPVGEKLSGLGEHRASATRSARSACSPTTSAAGSSARCARTGSRMAHAELARARRRGLRPGQASCAASPSSCCASTSKGIVDAPVPAEAARRRDRRHLRADRGALARHARSSRTRASSPRARSATSPTPSARAPRGRVRAQLRPDRAQRRRARSTAIAKLAYKRGEYGYALFED